MKRIIHTVLAWALVAALAITIFALSSQPADASSDTSAGLIEVLYGTFFPSFSSLSADEQAQMIEDAQFAVRKTAHFSAYALLGILFFYAYSRHSDKMKLTVPAAWASASVYAATDEIHQYFVPGRSCELRDVFIDSAGAAVGLALAVLCVLIYRKIKMRKGSSL